jgi:hypothetical protein
VLLPPDWDTQQAGQRMVDVANKLYTGTAIQWVAAGLAVAACSVMSRCHYHVCVNATRHAAAGLLYVKASHTSSRLCCN